MVAPVPSVDETITAIAGDDVHATARPPRHGDAYPLVANGKGRLR